MAYNDWTEYPRETKAFDALNATPREVVGATDAPIHVAGILISNQTANAAVVTFREVDDSPVRADFNIAADDTKWFPFKALWTNTEVLATGTAVDVNVYVQVADPRKDPVHTQVA